MSRTRKREENVTFTKDQREVTRHLMARAMNECDGILFFKPTTNEKERFYAARDALLKQMWRPLGIKPEHWCLLVERELFAFYDEGVMQFGRRGNTLTMAKRKMKYMVMVETNREQSRGKTQAFRYGRQNFVNRQATRPAPVF